MEKTRLDVCEKELVVVKYGSSSVSDEFGMDTQRLESYVDQIVELNDDYNVIVVSSGSINTGRSLRSSDMPILCDEDYAATGSGRAFVAWQDIFIDRGGNAAQVPVTNFEIDSSEGFVLERRLYSLIANGIVPIANGNDALSGVGAIEYKIDADNDRLAVHIGELTMAQHVLLLTDEDGLMRADSVVRQVDISNKRQLRYAKGLAPPQEPGENGGRGGMNSKVEQAVRAAHYGAKAHIANAAVDLRDVVASKSGTYFFDSKNL